MKIDDTKNERDGNNRGTKWQNYKCKNTQNLVLSSFAAFRVKKEIWTENIPPSAKSG